MRIFLRLSTLLLAGAAGLQPARAQTTGSFDTTLALTGGGPARAVSFYVPPTYTPATKYRLIVALHGLGDSCTFYRNALVNSLGWPAAFPNSIIVCPESENKSLDYYTSPGSEAVITETIGLAMAKYHIDTANLVLQGFSLGGRAALRYGLDHPGYFKGLLLNTPAFQGVKNAINGQAPQYAFNYGNADQVTIYMTHGVNDLPYSAPIDSAYERLVRANARVRYYDVPGLGHGIPTTAQMADVLPFFNAPARAGLDAEAVLLQPAPLLACSAPASAILLFRNTGQGTLNRLTFRCKAGSQTQTVVWNGILPSFRHAVVNVPFANLAAGDNPVTATIDSLNNAVLDTLTSNNQQSATLHYAPAPLGSLNEGFEGSSFPPSGWAAEYSGDFYTGWDVDNVAKTGSQSASSFNTPLYFDNSGREDHLVSPPVTLPAASPRLSFDVAYNYARYTTPYLPATTDFADTLDVSVSTDCGAHYTRIYRKGGTALATFAAPITNALSLIAAYTLQPADSNWRAETIDLAPFAGSAQPANALFRFTYRSALGGSVRIDNVRTSSATGLAATPHSTGYTVYPNPADDVLHIGGAQGTTATLVNTLGQVLRQQQLTGADESLMLTGLAPGLYLLQLTDAAGVRFATRVTKR